MKIAIIGGGFSAISLSLQLITKGSPPLSLFICEKRNDFGGTAYSTCYPWHLLNVRAAQMGADPADPEGFYRWLQNNENLWRTVDPAYKELSINKNAFLPRKLYHLYLSALFKEIKATASNKNIQFEMICDHVVDIVEAPKNELRIIFKNNKFLNCDKVVLATGVRPIKNLPFAISSSRYIGNLWELEEHRLKQQLFSCNKDSVILIIGTGLTMVDMLTSLDKLGYPGKIIALSRHGQLPEVHTENDLPPLGNLDKILAPKSLLSKLNAFRKELKEINDTGGHWLQLFETLRPNITTLWQQLSIQDKKRFLRHCFSLWNKHRHRMAPENLRLINRLRRQRPLNLEILRGRILDIREENPLKVLYEHDNTIKTVQADYVYNCTGPDYSLQNCDDPLIQSLMARGWIIPDSLGLGIKSRPNFCVEGPFSQHIYVMGSLLFGERFETTSVPFIRNHAQEVASQLLRYQ